MQHIIIILPVMFQNEIYILLINTRKKKINEIFFILLPIQLNELSEITKMEYKEQILLISL